MKLLIFDDDIADKTIEIDFPNSLHVFVYDRADNCLNLIQQNRPDVVLMDYHMRSSYKGEHAIRDIRCIYSAHELRIIAISSAEEMNHRMIHAGANEAVPKRHIQNLVWQLGNDGAG